MKFKIITHKEVVETNVFGKPARIHTYYTIERVVWFSFRSALEFTGQGGMSLPVAIHQCDEKVYVRYRRPCLATQFRTRQQAMDVLHDMYQNRDKYIRTI